MQIWKKKSTSNSVKWTVKDVEMCTLAEGKNKRPSRI